MGLSAPGQQLCHGLLSTRQLAMYQPGHDRPGSLQLYSQLRNRQFPGRPAGINSIRQLEDGQPALSVLLHILQ